VKKRKAKAKGETEKERERERKRHGRRSKTINKIARSEGTQVRICRISSVHFLPDRRREFAFHERSYQILSLNARRRIKGLLLRDEERGK